MNNIDVAANLRSELQINLMHDRIISVQFLVTLTCCGAVRLLQAADGMRVHVCEPDGVGEPEQRGGGPGLRGMEQRPESVVLWLRGMQGRHAGQPARGVAQSKRGAHRRRCRPHLRLRDRLQRIQERTDRGPLPPLQAGLCLRIPLICGVIIYEKLKKEKSISIHSTLGSSFSVRLICSFVHYISILRDLLYATSVYYGKHFGTYYNFQMLLVSISYR